MSTKVSRVHLKLQVNYKNHSHFTQHWDLSSEQSVRFNPQIFLSMLVELAIAKHPLQNRQNRDTLL